MSAGTWYVKNGRTAVNWGSDVSGGVAQVDIGKLVVGTVNEELFLFARAGQAVTSDQVTAAQAETTGGSVPAALLPGSAIAPGGTAPARRVPDWAANRSYVVGELVVSSGTIYRCTTAHTSAGSFDATKFTAVASGGGASGTSPQGQTVYADAPPSGSGLTAVAADGTTDDAARLNAALTYVKTTYGGGQVRIPAGKTVKLNSTITIPAKVQLYWPESTTLNFTSLGASTAIVVNDTQFTPIIGGPMIGPNTGDHSNFSSTNSTGISITGNNLNFERLQIERFQYGVDGVHDNTFIHHFTNCSWAYCGVAVNYDLSGYLDGRGVQVGNSGERIVFTGCVFANSMTIFLGVSSGVGLFFDGCSLDYSETFGGIADAHVFMSNCHIESKAITAGHVDWGTPNSYLFHMVNSGRLYMTNCNIIVSGQGVYHVLDPGAGPASYGDGEAIFSNCAAYFTPTGASSGIQDFSRKLVNMGAAGTTTKTMKSFFLSKWNCVSARAVSTDGYAQQPVTATITNANILNGSFDVVTNTATTVDPTWIEVVN